MVYKEYNYHFGYITVCLGFFLVDEILPSYVGITLSPIIMEGVGKSGRC